MKGFSRSFYLILIAFAPLILCRFDQGSSSLFMSEDNFDLADFPPDIFKAYSKQHLRASVNDSKNRRSLLESKNQSDLPAGLKHQSKEEANYLKLHKCKDAGEAYGAAYLITKEHLIEQFTGSKSNCFVVFQSWSHIIDNLGRLLVARVFSERSMCFKNCVVECNFID